MPLFYDAEVHLRVQMHCTALWLQTELKHNPFTLLACVTTTASYALHSTLRWLHHEAGVLHFHYVSLMSLKINVMFFQFSELAGLLKSKRTGPCQDRKCFNSLS